MRNFHIVLGILIAAVWGINFIAVSYALRDVSPILLCAIRFFLISIPAVFFCKPPQANRWLVLTYGVVMFALQFALMFIGLYLGMPAGMGSVLLQTQAFFTLFFALLFFKEKLSKQQLAGIGLAFLGIVLVAMNMGGEMTWEGFLFVMAAAFCWGLGSVLVKKMGRVNQVSLVVWASTISWPLLLSASLYLEGWEMLLGVYERAGWLTYLSILYTTLGS
ncbi:MAG: EamA family transporter, partial [Chlamydiia bacterium]|nr:EamA family transporter [Chlamydiia bacterium]